MNGIEKQFSAGGIIIRGRDDIRVLLIKDRFGYWTWPKGHIEKGETPEGAALREIEEETGLRKIVILELVGKQEYSFKYGEKDIRKTVYVYLLRAEGAEELRIQTSEIETGEWFAAEDALERIGYEDSGKMLKKAIRIYGDSE